MEVLRRIFLLDFMLIPTATSPLSFEIFIAYLYISFYFPLLFLRCSVCHCSYRIQNNSKSKAIWAMLVLTTLSLQAAIKEGSHQSQHCYHAIKCTFQSLRWLISPKRKNPYAPLCTRQYLFSFLLLLSCLGVCWVGFFFLVKFYTPERKISPIKTNKQKSFCGHVFLSNEHFFSRIGVLLNFVSFLAPTIRQQ